MRLILVGPQGSGKGTQGPRLSQRYGVPHVATGDLLRGEVRAGTGVGTAAKEYMGRGELVPDDLVLGMLRRRLEQPDAEDGFVLDGFPRNAAQAEALDRILVDLGRFLDAVVSFEVPEDVLVRRMSARAWCPTCGRPYARTELDPGPCPLDATPLVRRVDDEPEAIRRRLAIFREQTAPLISYYASRGLVVSVDGVGSVDEIEARIAKALEHR
jgi:adenylate kinase